MSSAICTIPRICLSVQISVNHFLHPLKKKKKKIWSISKDTYRNKTYGDITPP